MKTILAFLLIASLVCFSPVLAQPQTTLTPSRFSMGSNIITAQNSAQFTTALNRATSGQTIYMLPNSTPYRTADGNTPFVVPDGVNVVAPGGPGSVAVAMSDTATASINEATIRFMGNNYVYGLKVYTHSSAAGHEGGTGIMGGNHLFESCHFTAGVPGDVNNATGNQDCFMLGLNGASTDANKWSGPTVFRNCVMDDMNFDLIRIETSVNTTSTRRGLVEVLNCSISGGGAQRLVYPVVHGPSLVRFKGCAIDIDTAGNFALENLYPYLFPETANVKTFTGGNFDGTSAVGKTGIATGWTFAAGDFVRVTAPATHAGVWLVDAATSTADAIILTADIGGVEAGTLAGTLYHPTGTFMVPVSAADYNGTTNIVTKTGGFTDYTHADGDRLLVFLPATHAGIYTIYGKSDDTLNLVVPVIGGDETGTIHGFIVPRYQIEMTDCTVRARGSAALTNFIKPNASFTAAGIGVEIDLHNNYLDLPAASVIANGSSHATLLRQPVIRMSGNRYPGSAVFSNVGAANYPLLERGPGNTPRRLTPTGAAAVSINVQHGESAKWTTHAGNEEIDLTGTQSAGQELVLMITADAGGNRDISAGDNCSFATTTVNAGTLATIRLVSDGTKMYAAGITTGLTP